MDDLYYEVHITVEPYNLLSWEHFVAETKKLGWKASTFDVDEVDNMSGKWFLTARTNTLDKAKAGMRGMLHTLREQGLVPIRWKIEETLLDSKLGHGEDKLNA